MSNFSKKHYSTLNQIGQYIKTIKNRNMFYKSNNRPGLINYVNSDWDNDYIIRKSTTKYIKNNFISWLLKLQKSVAISLCEVEYMILKEVFKELMLKLCFEVRFSIDKVWFSIINR